MSKNYFMSEEEEGLEVFAIDNDCLNGFYKFNGKTYNEIAKIILKAENICGDYKSVYFDEGKEEPVSGKLIIRANKKGYEYLLKWKDKSGNITYTGNGDIINNKLIVHWRKKK
jgi:hypothetical protein